MTSHRDDDALGWAGDDDPTLASGSGQAPAEPEPEPESGGEPGREPAGEPEPDATHDVPDGWSVAGPTAAVEAEAARTAAAPTSSITLIALGIFGGVYLLYTIGWFLGITRIDNPLTEPVARFMFALGLWLAVAAPPAWFAATFWLTAGRPRARIGWLLAGALLLAPLPFVLGPGGIS